MKNSQFLTTIFALMSAALASADVETITYTNSGEGTSVILSNIGGYAFTLVDAIGLNMSPSKSYDEMPYEAYLTSITLEFQTEYQFKDTGVSLIVLRRPTDTASNSWDFVGKSENWATRDNTPGNGSLSIDGEFTFTFQNATLLKGQMYAFFFCAHKATYNSLGSTQLTVEGPISSRISNSAASADQPFVTADHYARVGVVNATLSEGAYDDEGSGTVDELGDDVHYYYQPEITMTVNLPDNSLPGVDPDMTGGGNVPEPTTVTLSLLSLAALAARRRR